MSAQVFHVRLCPVDGCTKLHGIEPVRTSRPTPEPDLARGALGDAAAREDGAPVSPETPVRLSGPTAVPPAVAPPPLPALASQSVRRATPLPPSTVDRASMPAPSSPRSDSTLSGPMASRRRRPGDGSLRGVLGNPTTTPSG